MTWLWIVELIARFIIGRIQPAAKQYALERGRTDETQIQEIAKAMVAIEPRLNFSCLMTVLPNFLENLTTVIKEKGLEDYPALIDVVLTSLVALVRCQLSTTTNQGPHAAAQLDSAIYQKLIQCGIKWGFSFMQTKDAAAAISGFIGCMLGGTTTPPFPNPPGGGGTGNPPGNIPPETPVLNQVGRCS